ncbi:MAG: glycosyltransferase family 2 protein, partial [Desulfobulbaceae bacterium]|nr:glycosyltransferase family 2 protein [Desulfobulbaceae bacterium]
MQKLIEMADFSVIILTLNEQDNLDNCLSALENCDDVVVLDSFSTDKTEEIARAHGARFFQHRFDNYAAQRNYGLNEITYKHDWLLMVDADEVVPAALAMEIQRMVETKSDDKTIFRMRRKDHFLGQWIKRSSGYPTWFGRLLKIGHVRVERAINEEYVTDGEVGYLENHLHHYPFNKGFSAWLEKHNRYSTMEAELIVSGGLALPGFKNLFAKDPTERRRAVKAIAYRVPGRPLLIFLGLYFLRGGFLDGRA